MTVLVGIIMGSKSDWPTMEHAANILDQLEVPYETSVVSAHRTPDRLFDYAESAIDRGLEVIIARRWCRAPTWYGGCKNPTACARRSRGIQSLKRDGFITINRTMPGGIPVGTLAIGNAGAKNAGLLVASILGIKHPNIREALDAFRAKQTENVLQQLDPRKDT